MKILTPRLELMPVTLQIVEADLHRRDELPALLDADIADGWPLPLMDVAAMQWLKQSLIDDSTRHPWTAWYWITREPRVLIGVSGFKSRPQNGVVEIGYGVVPAFQRRGFATEAVCAMTEGAFANGVDRVFAETLPELIASQKLLIGCGFTFVGEGSESGVMSFERSADGHVRTMILQRGSDDPRSSSR